MPTPDFFDDLETRSADARAAAQVAQLAALGVKVQALDDLARLPVLRKAELSEKQKAEPPFGG